MKQVFIFFMIFLTLPFAAQNMAHSIVVKDIETQLPLANATVVLMKTKQILLTNDEGKAKFELDGMSSIQVTIAGYESQTLRWNVLKENDFIIYLENKTSKLDEIILTKDPPNKILQKLVANSIRKMALSCRLKVYVREFFMLNGKYTYYNDGLVNFQFANKEEKFSTTLLVEQNRSYGLLNVDIAADLKGYNLNDIMENYCSFKYFDPILESKAEKKYSYVIRTHPTKTNYYVMSVKPFEEFKKIADNFEITYDSEKNIIVEFKIKASPEALSMGVLKSSFGSKKITDSFIKVTYRVDNSEYYVLSSTEEISFDVNVFGEIKHVQVRNNFVTTSFNKQKFTYNESDVFRDKSLFNKQNNIITNYWDISGLTATEVEKEIVKQLEFKE